MARSVSYCASTLASRLKISDRQLRRFFASRHTCTPHVFLNGLRLAAAHLALSEGQSVKCASALAGFKQVSHFSCLFKKAYGLCPSVFASKPGENLMQDERMSGFHNKCPVSITVLDSPVKKRAQAVRISN